MEVIFGILSATLIIGATAPYARDVLRGRARPARSSRVMFVLLLAIALYQQLQTGGGWIVAVTIGELVSSAALLALSMRYGVGGWQRIDIACYALLTVDLFVWWITGSALYGLYLTIVADIIAFWPTVYKTWRTPTSETPLWYAAGATAAVLSLVAGHADGVAVLFPLYLALANGVEVVLIYRLSLQRCYNKLRDTIFDRSK